MTADYNIQRCTRL